MNVYVGMGQDPLWMMGPAFIGQQQPASPVQPTLSLAKDAYKAASSRQDLTSSWETIPEPPKRPKAIYLHLPRPQVKHRPAPLPGPVATAPASTPEGIIRALLNWLSS